MKAYLLILLSIFLLGFSVNNKTDNPLEGLWKIHIIEFKNESTGKWEVSDWMKGGTAYLLYDATENMSIFFTPANYENEQMPNTYFMDSLELDDLKVLASDYWYLGKYRVLEKEKIIEHTRTMHSDPNDWNKVVQRKYEFKGDTLVLSPIEFNMRLKWLRE